MICVSLGSISFGECVKAIGKAEFIEIRIDLLDFSEEQFKTLFSLKRNSIATCRIGKYDEQQRLAILKFAIESGAGYVDVEYEAEEAYRTELIDFAHKHNAKVIISYHNYEITPSRKELGDIISQSFIWGGDYAKLATMATTEIDNARVLGLYEDHKNLIAFCMGKTGVITRLAAPLLGSLFTFAALNSESATAPGQLTCDQFVDLYRGLGV